MAVWNRHKNRQPPALEYGTATLALVRRQYEETEQEVEARQDREFEEAQQIKFHTPWRMNHVSKQKGQNITMQDYKDGRRCYPMIESIADFWQQICNVPMPTELKVTHREDMYTVL